MPKNIHWFEEHMGEIWNAAAAVINELIEAEHIQIPPAFSLGSLVGVHSRCAIADSGMEGRD